jgi:hypothetical protein
VYNGSCSKLIDNLFKEVKMSKVLTPTQTELVAARAAFVEAKQKVAEARLIVRALVAQSRKEKAMVKQVKVDLRQVKRANAIAKAQARLEKLMSKPVGASARKASKKPSPVVVTRMAA